MEFQTWRKISKGAWQAALHQYHTEIFPTSFLGPQEPTRIYHTSPAFHWKRCDNWECRVFTLRDKVFPGRYGLRNPLTTAKLAWPLSPLPPSAAEYAHSDLSTITAEIPSLQSSSYPRSVNWVSPKGMQKICCVCHHVSSYFWFLGNSGKSIFIYALEKTQEQGFNTNSNPQVSWSHLHMHIHVPCHVWCHLPSQAGGESSQSSLITSTSPEGWELYRKG